MDNNGLALPSAALAPSGLSPEAGSQAKQPATSAKHTPGPWILGPAATILGSNGQRVCTIATRIRDSDIADAELIKAAPELLTALYQYRDDLRYPPAPDSIERRIEMLDKLIAKAAGAA